MKYAVWKPRRPRLEQARRAVEGATDNTKAWKRLAEQGVIPREWLEDPRRKFQRWDEWFCEVCKGDGRGRWVPGEDLGPADCGRCDGDGREWRASEPSSTPPDLEACLIFASDPEGVADAESLALECNARLRDWGVGQVTTVTWRVGSPLLSPDDPLPDGLRLFLDQAARQDPRLQSEVGHVRALVQGDERSRVRPRFAAAAHAEGAALFEALVLGDARVECPPDVAEWRRAQLYPPTILGKRLSAVPNPYEPLLKLWALGYGIGSHRPGGIQLYAPSLEESPPPPGSQGAGQ